MSFDILFGHIFGSLIEIILKICEDFPIGLLQLSEKLGGYWSRCSDKNGAKDVALSCNIMSDNLICFKFFGQIPCKSISDVTKFCKNWVKGRLLNAHLFQEFGAGRNKR